MMDLSIIIPAYNEEKRIAPTIEKIMEYLSANTSLKRWEIIIIDDGSKDNTRNLANEAIHKDSRIRINIARENKGKGFSVREGALMASYNLILFSDADLSTPIKELDRFLAEIKDYDIIIGSRALKNSKVEKHQPLYRELIGKIFNLLVRRITGLNLHDTQCGFKLFKNCRNIFEQQKIPGWSFDVELLYLAGKAGKKILEKPVTWINDERSKVNAVKDSYKMFMDLLKIRKMHRKNKELSDGASFR